MMKSSSFLWKRKIFKSIYKFEFMKNSKFLFSTLTPGQPGGVSTPPPRKHGGLKDTDRIFTNLYRDGDPFIEGALKRVIIFNIG